MRKATWDTERGHQMWKEGKKDTEIAIALSIPTSTVTNYRLKHWAAPIQKPQTLAPTVAAGTEPTKAEENKSFNFQWTTLQEDLNEKNSGVPVPETHAPAIQRQHDEPLATGNFEIMDVLAAATEHLSGIRAVCTASAIQSLWFWRYPEDLRRARDTIDYLLKRLEVEQ